jgi:hypothetical protein
MGEESGGGCRGGRGEMIINSGEAAKFSVNFCPGQGVPSLQVNLAVLRVRAVKAAAKAGGGGGGEGHYIKVAGQQSQSISASI